MDEGLPTEDDVKADTHAQGEVDVNDYIVGDDNEPEYVDITKFVKENRRAYRKVAHQIAASVGTELSDEQIDQLWDRGMSVLEIENALQAWKHDQDTLRLIAEKSRSEG